MTDETRDGADRSTAQAPASTAAEKDFENEGGPSRVQPTKTRTARTADPMMDRIARSAGRIKARLAARP